MKSKAMKEEYILLPTIGMVCEWVSSSFRNRLVFPYFGSKIRKNFSSLKVCDTSSYLKQNFKLFKVNKSHRSSVVSAIV